jgi:hypothetical protein
MEAVVYKAVGVIVPFPTIEIIIRPNCKPKNKKIPFPTIVHV